MKSKLPPLLFTVTILLLVSVQTLFYTPADPPRIRPPKFLHRPAPPAHQRPAPASPDERKDVNEKLVVSIIVTFLVLAAALFLILFQEYSDADRKWAYGAVGTIVGYWLG